VNDVAFALYSAAELAVETHAVAVRFGATSVLEQLRLAVPWGSAYALVGSDGAGKSTLLRTVLGLVRPTAGAVHVLGEELPGAGPTVRVAIGYVAERLPPAWSALRVSDLLRYRASYFPRWDADYAARCLRRLELRPDSRLRDLVPGQQRLAHAVAMLAHRPRLLVWDEPTLDLDPVARAQAFELLIEHMSEDDVTLLVATNRIHDVARLIDHVGILAGGGLRAQLPVDDLRQRLRMYRFDAPDGWSGAAAVNAQTVARQTSGRTRRWTIWGAEAEVRRALASAGAEVHDTETLSLEEAVFALLAMPGDPR